MIQTAVLSDALAEAVISANIQPLLRRSFGEGRFSLFLGINRENLPSQQFQAEPCRGFR
jgi:hypothetical protein